QSSSDAPTSPGLSPSAISAFPHFKAGLSIAQTAERMARAESTVRGYLDQFLSHEQVTDPSPWVDDITTARVHEAVEAVGSGRLKPIFEHLGGEVAYEQIRIVARCLANVDG
ncbi:MAG: helix-turn-helix domain-containing protein, partial [Bythopirellula sp.]